MFELFGDLSVYPNLFLLSGLLPKRENPRTFGCYNECGGHNLFRISSTLNFTKRDMKFAPLGTNRLYLKYYSGA